MTQTEIYIEKYKQLESLVRRTYHLRDRDSISEFLQTESKFQRYKDDIDYCQRIRNILQHGKKINNDFSLIPNQAIIDFIDRLIFKIENRPRCFDIAIKMKDVYAEGMDGLVKDAMEKMRKNLYTHIPLLNDGIVVGVFDENSVFNYLADQQIAMIEDDLSFCNVEQYVQIDGREMEDFIFVRPNMYLEDLEVKFEERFNQKKRIGMVFITKDGKKTSELLGIITAWDVIAARKIY